MSTNWLGLPPELLDECIEAGTLEELRDMAAQLAAYGWQPDGKKLSRIRERVAELGSADDLEGVNASVARAVSQRTKEEVERCDALVLAINQLAPNLKLLATTDMLLEARGWLPTDRPRARLTERIEVLTKAPAGNA